jgi:hypothetical protein
MYVKHQPGLVRRYRSGYIIYFYTSNCKQASAIVLGVCAPSVLTTDVAVTEAPAGCLCDVHDRISVHQRRFSIAAKLVVEVNTTCFRESCTSSISRDWLGATVPDIYMSKQKKEPRGSPLWSRCVHVYTWQHI